MRLMAPRYKYLLFDLVIVPSAKVFYIHTYIYIHACVYIYAHKLFTSKHQTSLSLKDRMATTFNYFTSLSFSLLNLLERGEPSPLGFGRHRE